MLCSSLSLDPVATFVFEKGLLVCPECLSKVWLSQWYVIAWINTTLLYKITNVSPMERWYKFYNKF